MDIYAHAHIHIHVHVRIHIQLHIHIHIHIHTHIHTYMHIHIPPGVRLTLLFKKCLSMRPKSAIPGSYLNVAAGLFSGLIGVLLQGALG